jgi:hypothetical protein
MSINLKETILLFLGVVSFLYAQEDKKQESTTIFINFEDHSLESSTINKDTTFVRFTIYLKGYETPLARKKELKKYKNRIGDPNSAGPPEFSIGFSNFSACSQKPEKLASLNGIKYITLDEFKSDNFRSTKKVYIIHKLKNGTYLKWETSKIDYN